MVKVKHSTQGVRKQIRRVGWDCTDSWAWALGSIPGTVLFNKKYNNKKGKLNREMTQLNITAKSEDTEIKKQEHLDVQK